MDPGLRVITLLIFSCSAAAEASATSPLPSAARRRLSFSLLISSSVKAARGAAASLRAAAGTATC